MQEVALGKAKLKIGKGAKTVGKWGRGEMAEGWKD